MTAFTGGALFFYSIRALIAFLFHPINIGKAKTQNYPDHDYE